MIELVWLVNPDGMFERDWIEYLFRDVPHVTIRDQEDTRYESPIFIFNISCDYEQYLLEFQDERIPYGVIHLSDETLQNTCNYLESPSCLFAIRNYHHPILYKNPKVITIGLGYKYGFTDNPSIRSSTPWFHWCFIGALHNQERRDAVTSFLQLKPYLLKMSNGGFNSESLTTAEYKQTMILSKFALCPIGQGNLDTFRFYEAMESGCVPVVLNRTEKQQYYPSYWHHLFGVPESFEIPVVMGASWQECMTIVEELLQDPRKYVELHTKMTTFWELQKDQWKLQIEQLSKQLITACSP